MPDPLQVDDAYTLRLRQLAEGGSWDDPKALLARMLLQAEREEMPSGGLRADAEAFLGVADISKIKPDESPLQVDERETIARSFHERYERLAVDFGYATREASAVPWSKVPDQNRHLMLAVVGELLRDGVVVPVSVVAARDRQLLECEEALRSTTDEANAFRETMATPLNEREGRSVESLSWDELFAVASRNLNAALDAETRVAARDEEIDRLRKLISDTDGETNARRDERQRVLGELRGIDPQPIATRITLVMREYAKNERTRRSTVMALVARALDDAASVLGSEEGVMPNMSGRDAGSDNIAHNPAPAPVRQEETGTRERRWLVYSEEDDTGAYDAPTAAEAVELWRRGCDIEDGQTITAMDCGLMHEFTVEQTNVDPDGVLDVEPEFRITQTDGPPAASLPSGDGER